MREKSVQFNLWMPESIKQEVVKLKEKYGMSETSIILMSISLGMAIFEKNLENPIDLDELR